MAKKVIDVSYAQGWIDWDKTKNYIDGAILRCGYGSDQANQDDSQWLRNVRECERLGIPYGVYLYSYAGNDVQIQSEINHTLRLLRHHDPVLGVFLDLEENSLGYIASKHAKTWCKQIAEAGYKPGIYCGAYYYKSYLIGVHESVTALWWIAGYGRNSGFPEYNFQPNPGFVYDAWQYTSNGHIPGIGIEVDVSEWYIDFDARPDKPTQLIVPHIEYAVKTLNHGIQPAVRDGESAGCKNDAIIGVAIRAIDHGSVKYRVHLLNGIWLPWVYGYDWKNGDNGYAGVGLGVIDAIQIMYYTDTEKTNGIYYEAVYAVKPANGNKFYPDVHDTDEAVDDGTGTAGVFGMPFVEIKISLREC